VGLEFADLFQGGAEVGPVLFHLVVGGLAPEQIAGDAAHAQGGQAEGLGGGIDLAEVGLV
jgi:hypothetical protein